MSFWLDHENGYDLDMQVLEKKLTFYFEAITFIIVYTLLPTKNIHFSEPIFGCV